MIDHSGLANARLSLEGLSVGDAFGELFFTRSALDCTWQDLPKGQWLWTDDTHMALSVVDVLEMRGRIDQDLLAAAFARRFGEDPYRGYAGGAVELLTRIAGGAYWGDVSPRLFGTGSYGNGAAMRAAPIGAFFSRDPDRAAREAGLSALITHAHPEGQAGAIAVAVAAAYAASAPARAGVALLEAVAGHLEPSATRRGIEEAMLIAPDELMVAVTRLGTGARVSAQDTVPFCLWCAAHHLHDYEQAMWVTVRGYGDCDTTCAIVGGIVALSAGAVPPRWIERREPLPGRNR